MLRLEGDIMSFLTELLENADNPEEFKALIDRNPHLKMYLEEFIDKTGSIPKYLSKLSRELRGLRMPNIIYLAGEPIFIHIYSISEDRRPIYHPVEPRIPGINYKLIEIVEEALAYVIDDKYDYSSAKEHEELIKRALRETVSIDNSILNLGEFRIKEDRYGYKKIFVNKLTYDCLEYFLIREKVGLGVLEPFIRDSYIEDITCNGLGPLFVEHKIFHSLETTVKFESEEELDEFIIKLSERIGRPVDYRRPIVDAVLPDGSRINIVFGKDISQKGSNFTIRKFSEIPLSIIQLCLWNTMSFLEAAYLWMLLENGLSVWICGETASGKTTTLKAITTFIDPNAKIISIEDTPEVVVPHENWTREVTRESEDKSASVQMYDLLRAALRQRPNYIIVGEIRGIEGSVAFQAMQTGHPVMATFHAASVEKLIQRLTGSPIEIPKTYIDNLNAVVIQSAVRLPKTGRLERRVISINEIIGYDPVDEQFHFIELFTWDPATDRHEFRGEGMSYLLENKIARMKGIPERKIRKIYEELFMREEILRLLGEMGVTNYYDVWEVIKKSRIIGLEKMLEILRGGKLP